MPLVTYFMNLVRKKIYCFLRGTKSLDTEETVLCTIFVSKHTDIFSHQI